MENLVRERVKLLKAYKVKKEDFEIKLDANESPYNILDILEYEIIKNLKKEKINRYPDSDSEELRKLLAQYVGLEEDNIICGNGSDEIIRIILDAFIDKDDVVVTHSPSFVMYKISTEIVGGKIIEVESDEKFQLDINNIINVSNEKNAKAIFLCNPNNPTGTYISKEEIIKVIENTNAVVVVDEAYIEFYGSSVIDEIEKYERLIVLRTLSKAFGLAGIRLGYGAAQESVIDILNKVKAPYNLNSISQIIGRVALENIDKVMKNIEAIIDERNNLMNQLKELKEIELIPSASNFILIRTERYEEIIKKFKAKLMMIKGYGNEGKLKNCIRLTVGTKEENHKVLSLLKEVF